MTRVIMRPGAAAVNGARNGRIRFQRKRPGLSLGQWHYFLADFGADVFAEGAEEAVVAELLEDVGGPAGHARDGENGGEEVRGDAEGVVDRRGVEIDVRVEALPLLHGGGDALGHLDPFGLAELIGE